MSAGLLRNWYASKVVKSKNPLEYFFAMQEFAYYEIMVSRFNVKEKISKFFDKYK